MYRSNSFTTRRNMKLLIIFTLTLPFLVCGDQVDNINLFHVANPVNTQNMNVQNGQLVPAAAAARAAAAAAREAARGGGGAAAKQGGGGAAAKQGGGGAPAKRGGGGAAPAKRGRGGAAAKGGGAAKAQGNLNIAAYAVSNPVNKQKMNVH